MSEKYKPAAGDRVRVVLEGEVSSDTRGYFHVGKRGEGNSIKPDAEHVISIEKIEPPVTVFKPGDVVRSKRYHYVMALDKKGYTYLSGSMNDGHRFPFHVGSPAEQFTSEHYEKVNLSS